MCEEFSAYTSKCPQVNEALEDCVSDCYVLPVPIPRIIKVLGPGESQSDLPEEVMCLDSETEQEVSSMKLDAKVLSKANQLIDFDTSSLSNSRHTCDTEALSNTELSTDSTLQHSQTFTGYADQCHVENHATEPKTLDSEVEIKQETPATIAIANTIGTVNSRKFLKVLLDSGSMVTLIHKRALPKGVQGKLLSEAKNMTTLAGNMSASRMVKLRDLRLPEFNKNMNIEEHKALVFDANCRYDIIFGSDFLTKVGMKINYEEKVVEWYDSKLPLRNPKALENEDFKEMEDSLCVQVEDELLGDDWLQSYATEILDAKYEKADIYEVVNKQLQLNKDQRNGLLRVLLSHESLFLWNTRSVST